MDEALIKRVLPHSIEAEQAVIGAMLIDKEAILTSSEIISGADFYQSAYGVIFEAIVEIYNEGKPVDLITLQEQPMADSSILVQDPDCFSFWNTITQKPDY